MIGWKAMADAKKDPFQKMEVHLPEGAAAVVPVDDVDPVLRAGQAADLFEHDEVGWETPSEFIVIFFVKIGIVDIEIGGAGLEIPGEIVEEIGDMGADKIGATGLDGPAQ